MTQFDYLAIGHLAKDITATGYMVGGTVSYAGRTARSLGCRTAALTSAGPDCDLDDALPGITVECVPAKEITTFENIYTPTGRRQIIHGVAAPLTAAQLPAGWNHIPIVHLGPIASEIDPRMINLFSNSLIGLTPQGWMRTWDADGHVHSCTWPEARNIVPLAAAVILSEDDLPDQTVLVELRRWSRLLVLTLGSEGCLVFLGNEEQHFAAPSVTEVNPTGAGDIFAAAYLFRLYQTKGNPWEAATFANNIAAYSVTQPDLASKTSNLHLVAAGNVDD